MRIIMIALLALLQCFVTTPALAQRGEVPTVSINKVTYRPASTSHMRRPGRSAARRRTPSSAASTMLTASPRCPRVKNTVTPLDGATIAWNWPATTSSKGVHG